MFKCDTVVPLICAMKKRKDSVHVAAETIKKLYDLMIPELVVQAVNGELIPFLLKLLEDPLSECDKPSATKALIAESLKNMAKDLANGERILEILEKSPVWSAYKDQKHDLFLTNTTVSGYLTGPSGIAGYLTAGSSSSANNANSSAPPPLEPPEDTPAGDDDDDD
ncbi:dnaJ homolog subfamily C member 13-like [Halichondria panicea]|uniref:dnaJ homolog subfamily C member 13-like n=1 Tax=Halichondria panicea TaxID=6063 RepID=UPI00312B3C8C